MSKISDRILNVKKNRKESDSVFLERMNEVLTEGGTMGFRRGMFPGAGILFCEPELGIEPMFFWDSLPFDTGITPSNKIITIFCKRDDKNEIAALLPSDYYSEQDFMSVTDEEFDSDFDKLPAERRGMILKKMLFFQAFNNGFDGVRRSLGMSPIPD